MYDGTPIFLYTLKNRRGMEARVTTYGAILVSLKTRIVSAGRPM
jgi:galactose mutarotase-like enzyme